MTVARLLPLVLLAGSGAAAGETIDADTAMKRYREQFGTIDQVDCPRDGEIVVCGRKIGQGLRIPYQRAEGEPVRLLPGEPPSARGAQNADRMCMRNCEPPKGSILNIIKGVGALLGRDD